jgi:hypothetical protein
LQPVLQVGKQVVVAQSKTKAVKRVVKQLPVEMLSSAEVRSAIWVRNVIEKHDAVCQ